MPPTPPPRDRYAQHRRGHLTASVAPSPISLVRDLYGRVYTQLPFWIQEEITDDKGEYMRMITSSAQARTAGDDLHCLPPMHWHPRTIVRAGNSLNALREAAIDSPPIPTVFRSAEKVISYWTSANSLKQLHRFTDSRQPDLYQIPLPDGSNLPDSASPDDVRSSLREEWMLRRAFVRLLHLPGIWFSGEKSSERLKAFANLYGIGRCLLEFELERCPTIDNAEREDDYYMDPENPHEHLFTWIRRARDIIEIGLNEVAEVAYEEHPTMSSRFFPGRTSASPTPLTREEKLRRNLTPQFMPIMLDKMIKKYDEYMSIYPFERLIMDLLEKEDTFERLLTHEHVEDRLINKQIVPYDELDITQGPEYNAFDIESSFMEEEQNPCGVFLENFIYKVTAGISLVNRQRRNFRLMRDWVKHRPWCVLVHVYNSSIPGNEWQKEAIEEFHERGLREPYEEEPFIPSHHPNVLSNLFGIYPFDVREPELHGRDLFTCGLCGVAIPGGNESTNTMAILPCPENHNFHVGCVMFFWDREGKYTLSCPLCGKTPLITHERLGMHPNDDDPYFNTADPTFVNNPFGFIIRQAVPPDLTPVGAYDIPSGGSDHRYWARENALAAAVANAPVSWRGEAVTDEVLARSGGDDEFARVVRSLGHRWRVRNMDLLQSEDYAMEEAYDAARFSPSEEAAWLRMVRRRRDRNRRRRIALAGEGLRRYGR